jgi:hypothetical protein
MLTAQIMPAASAAFAAETARPGLARRSDPTGPKITGTEMLVPSTVVLRSRLSRATAARGTNVTWSNASMFAFDSQASSGSAEHIVEQ